MTEMNEHEAGIALQDLLNLILEYRLTIAVKIADGCECPRYFIERSDVLLPEIIKTAKKKGEEPIEVFADFARKVHARHEGDLDD